MEGCVDCDGEEGCEEGCCGEGEEGEWSVCVNLVFGQTFDGSEVILAKEVRY